MPKILKVKKIVALLFEGDKYGKRSKAGKVSVAENPTRRQKTVCFNRQDAELEIEIPRQCLH